MRNNDVLRVVAGKLLIPFILLFGLYVQFHGDYGPGGGFQAGVIMGSAVILYGMIFGLSALRAAIPPVLLETLVAIGVLIYAGTGLVCMLLGGNFLEYGALGLGNEVRGQHWGILLIELGVGVTVASVMTAVFLAFASREAAE